MAIALMLGQDMPIWLAVLATLGIGLAIGLFHAFGIVQLGLPPFIMTLASLTALRGVGLLITNGATISITNDTFTGFSRGDFLGVPNLFWMVLVVAIPAYFFLHQSRWGTLSLRDRIEHGGGAPFGCQRQGDHLHRLHLIVDLRRFVGVLLAMRIGIGNPTQRKVGNCKPSPRRLSGAPVCLAPSARFRGLCWALLS